MSYVQNFDSTSAGSLPTGWVNDSHASVAAFGSANSAPNVLDYTGDPSSAHWCYYGTADTNAGNNTYQVYAYFTADYDIAELIYRLNPGTGITNGTYYSLEIQPASNNNAFNRTVSGTATALYSFDQGGSGGFIPLNTWIRMKVIVTGNRHQCEVYIPSTGLYVTAGGTTQTAQAYCSDFTDTSGSAIAGAGMAGTFAYLGHGANLYFDDFSISPFAGAGSPAVSPTSATLQRGATQQLTASGFTGGSVTWASSNAGVATVSGSGLVTAVGAGNTTITATGVSNTSETATCAITSDSVTVAVSPTSATVLQLATQQLTPTVTGAVNTAVTYATSDGTVATVNSSGLVTAQAKAGTATITLTSAADSSSHATSAITVPAGSYAVSPTSATLSRGATQQLTASGFTGTAVTWSSSNSGVATVSGSGLVTAVSAGSATITATGQANGGETATCAITSNAVTVAVSPSTVTVPQLGTQQLTPTVTGAVNTAVTYSTSDATVATVSGSGLVAALAKAGTATITVTSAADGTVHATSTITVPAVAVSISPTAPGISISGTQQFTATVTGTTNTSVTWSQSGGVSVSSSGLFTAGTSAGSATVTATSQADTTKSASASVTVAATVTIYDEANFGGGYAGLTGTIGLAWKDVSNNVAQARTTAGITEIAPGIYSGSYAAPAGSGYYSIWDTGGSTPFYLSSYVPLPAAVTLAAGAITSASFGTVNAGPTGLLERLLLLVARFFPVAGGSVTAPKSGNGSLVVRGSAGTAIATQSVADDGSTQTLGAAT